MDIILAGCGALGSWVAMMLAGNTEIGGMFLLDDDRIEEGNLATTVYLDHQVDATKVYALAELLYRKRVNAIPIHGTVHSQRGVLAYAEPPFVVVDTFDNVEARLFTRHPNTIHAGVSESRTGEAVWEARWVPPTPSGFARGENPVCTRHLGAPILQLTAWHTANIIRRFIETGARLDAPLIMESGDVIR